MLYSLNEASLLSLIIVYLITYNSALMLLFYLIFFRSSGDWYTLKSFLNLSTRPVDMFIALVSLLSLAGVPPLIGFFAKIIILVVLLNSNFFFIYMFLFSLLLLGLYFYLQNLRYLFYNSPAPNSLTVLPKKTSSRMASVAALFVLIFLFCGG